MNSPGGEEQIEKSEEEKGEEGRKFCPSERNNTDSAHRRFAGFFCAVLLCSGDRSARASAEPLGCAHTFESSTKQQLLRSTILKRGAGCYSDCAHANRRMTTLSTVRLRLAAI